MSAFRAAARTLVALFIEDGSLALAALAWLGLSALLAHFAPSFWVGPIFFLGLALLLAGNVRHATRTLSRR